LPDTAHDNPATIESPAARPVMGTLCHARPDRSTPAYYLT
jgi:hypothetical protein